MLLLHERYAHLARFLARRICRDQGLAEEVVQEVFLMVWREPLLLAYYGGYTYREISELVEVPLGTVKSRIFLGIRRLRILLRPLLDLPPTM